MPDAVDKVDEHSERRPDHETAACVRRRLEQACHHDDAGHDAGGRDKPDSRRPERALRPWRGDAKDHDPAAHRDEGEQRSDRHELGEDVERKRAASKCRKKARDDRAAMRRVEIAYAPLRMSAAGSRRAPWNRTRAIGRRARRTPPTPDPPSRRRRSAAPANQGSGSCRSRTKRDWPRPASANP